MEASDAAESFYYNTQTLISKKKKKNTGITWNMIQLKKLQQLHVVSLVQ